MKKSTRLIIFSICLLLFIIISPIIVAYSMGYRFDFQKIKIVATGGIYVRTFPEADTIIIDSFADKPGIFSNSVFVQNLLPEDHTIKIIKEGYHDYEKVLPVVEKEVTKLENVTLFKKNIFLAKIENNENSPLLEGNEDYILKNNIIYSGTIPVVRNVLAFKEDNDRIIWLSTNGTILETSDEGLNRKTITKVPFKISSKGAYEVILENGDIFVRENKNIFLFNEETDQLENLYDNANGLKISPDGKQLIYWNDKTVFLAPAGEEEKILYKSSGNNTIANLQWINNYYFVFTSGDRIIISETDWRGNINAVDISDPVLLNIQAIDEKITSLKDAKIYFDRQTGKLDILIKDSLFESERLI